MASAFSPTWEINSGSYRGTCCDGGVNQVGILQPEPGGERTWVRATKCHPLAVCQPPPLSNDSAEVSQVSQRLATAEETQVVCAEVPERTEQATEGSVHGKHVCAGPPLPPSGVKASVCIAQFTASWMTNLLMLPTYQTEFHFL